MTDDDYAEFLRVSYLVFGSVLCFTIVFAPLGVLLIRAGKREAERIRAEATRRQTTSMDVEDALVLGVATSWDDIDLGPAS